MNWEYTFAKKITLTDYYKSYLHETTYSKSTTTVKGYVVDTETTFFKRNSTSNNVTSKSFSYSSGTATRYSYGSKYQLSKPVISLNNNTYTQCTMKVYNPNPVTVTYYDRDVNSSGYTTISAYGTITYNYAWSGGIYDTESHTFSGYVEAYQCYGSSTDSETVSKPYDTKPTLTKPSITVLSNTNYSFTVRYTNNASTSVTMYTYNGNFSLSSGGTKDFTVVWSTSSVSLYAWASKTNYNDSDTARTTVSRPAKTILDAPTISLNNNTYTQCTIAVKNPNSVTCTYYDRDVSSSGYIDISANSTITYNYAWSKGQYEQETHIFEGYLTASGYTSSSTSKLSVDKPYDVKPVLSSPIMSYTKGTGVLSTKYKITISNPNSTNVTCSYTGPDIDGYTVNINAKSFTYFYVDVLAIEDRTYKAVFSKSGYDDVSSTMTIYL